MIKIENARVFNFEGAFRGLRNPKDSWHLSDSVYGIGTLEDAKTRAINVAQSYKSETEEQEKSIINHLMQEGYNDYLLNSNEYGEFAFIGAKDMNLAQRMIAAGTDESKFMRQIFVSMDLTAPLFVWKEIDTYKVATVANSCSTMHTMDKKEITEDFYSFDPEESLEELPLDDYNKILTLKKEAVDGIEWLRKRYKETKDKRYWRLMIQLNPDGWMQKRTWTANYQVLRAQYFARRYHKNVEWRIFCKELEKFPYGKELICYTK